MRPHRPPELVLPAAPVPQLLYWDVSDNFGQTRLSPLAAITPANRENVNYVSTGPDLTIGALGSTELGIAGRYAKATYQKSPLDNERISGTIALVRHFTLASAISLNVLDGRIR